jgi:hypothetical protein
MNLGRGAVPPSVEFETLASPVPGGFSRRPDWVAAAALTLATIALHMTFFIQAGGLWRDEVNLVNLAGSSSLHAMNTFMTVYASRPA